MPIKRSPSAIEPRSLDVQAADLIRDEILSGVLPPGARLLEIELSERLQLSRGTIRSALQQLIHEGLVVQYPYRGCAVVRLSSQDAWELHTLRSALEGLAAKLAAETITPVHVEQLEACLQELVAATDNQNWQAFANSDFALHKTIIELSGHRRLQEQYKIVEHQIRLYISSCNALYRSLDELLGDHRQLVQAIASGDAQLAEQIAKEHNTDGKQLVEYLQQLEKQATLLKTN